eukprot:g61570.t1
MEQNIELLCQRGEGGTRKRRKEKEEGRVKVSHAACHDSHAWQTPSLTIKTLISLYCVHRGFSENEYQHPGLKKMWIRYLLVLLEKAQSQEIIGTSSLCPDRSLTFFSQQLGKLSKYEGVLALLHNLLTTFSTSPELAQFVSLGNASLNGNETSSSISEYLEVKSRRFPQVLQMQIFDKYGSELTVFTPDKNPGLQEINTDDPLKQRAFFSFPILDLVQVTAPACEHCITATELMQLLYSSSAFPPEVAHALSKMLVPITTDQNLTECLLDPKHHPGLNDTLAQIFAKNATSPIVANKKNICNGRLEKRLDDIGTNRIQSITLLDAQGVSVASTRDTSPFFLGDTDPFLFSHSHCRGNIYISPPFFDPYSETSSLTLMMPMTSFEQLVGVAQFQVPLNYDIWNAFVHDEDYLQRLTWLYPNAAQLLGIQIVGVILLLLLLAALFVLLRYRKHPVVRMSSVSFRILMLIGIASMALLLSVIFFPVLNSLDTAPARQILLALFSLLLGTCLFISLFAKRFILLYRFPKLDDYRDNISKTTTSALQRKEKSVMQFSYFQAMDDDEVMNWLQHADLSTLLDCMRGDLIWYNDGPRIKYKSHVAEQYRDLSATKKLRLNPTVTVHTNNRRDSTGDFLG